MTSAITNTLSSLKHKISVWISIVNEKVALYDVQTVENKISGVFESIEGTNFAVHYLDNKTSPTTGRGVEVCVDGAKVVDIVYDVEDDASQDINEPNNREKVYSGVQVSSRRERPFIFQKASVTDDDDVACKDDTVLQNLGVITLKIWRCTLKPKRAKKSLVPSVTVPADNIIDEKEKNISLSHKVGYGAPVPNGEKDQMALSEYDLEDPLESPLLVFELKYMSRALLELNANKPINRTYRVITPEPLQEEIPNEQEAVNEALLEDEETQALAEAEAAIQAIKDRIAKRKAEASVIVAEKKIKVEEDELDRKIKEEAGYENLGAILLLDSDSDDED